MKKLLISLLIIPLAFLLMSCNQEKFQVPDLIGMDLNDAKLLIAGEVKTEVTYISTNEFLPNMVIGFEDGIEVNDMVKQNSTIKLQVAQAPEGSFSHSDMISYVYDVGFVTGPESQNFDILRESGVGSTDLGIPVSVGDKMIYLYGDTFSGTENMTGMWRSNFIAISNDSDLSDGLTFSSLVTNDRNMILPFAPGLHQSSVPDSDTADPDREVTKIPTGGITIGNDVYLFYMSVRYWGSAGAWAVNYNQAVKTTPDFDSFTEVEGLRWTEEDAYNFGQIYPFENPEDTDRIYFISIPGGRFGGIALFRVQKSQFENIEAYEYYLGNDTWATGSDGLASFKSNPYLIVQPACSELSIMYNQYLQKWMMVYLRGSEIIMQTADSLTGSWSIPETIVNSGDFGGLYGGFVHPNLTEYNGQKFYIQLSRWLPIYETQLIEVVLK